MINVTEPFLPALEEYNELLKGIWQRNWLTNNGPLVNEFELKIKEYLDVEHMLFTNNGTTALQIAYKALGIKGDVITTPFTYIATISSLVWENLNPIMVDIDPHTFNIDPKKVEKAITPKTTAIVATHVFGNPCDIEALEHVAKKNNLKLIYDAAHCFGVKYKGNSVFSYGDVSVTSFHATKLFHTIEGGGLFTKDPELLKTMALMRNFGHDGPAKFSGVGINGKCSEMHAAMGLVNLKYADNILSRRKSSYKYYDEILVNLNVNYQKIQESTIHNYSYYPIVFQNEEDVLRHEKVLNDNWIYPRRYFYPSLNELDYVTKYSLEVSESISRRILCLPMFYNLSKEAQEMIKRLLLRTQRFG